MDFVIIIPARFFSSRFPGKLLADIHGKPMIIRVVEKALETEATKIIVATDNISVMQVIELEYSYSHSRIAVCLTKSTHQSGTERISEVIRRYNFSDNQFIVHLQSDEPLISSDMIYQVVRSLYTGIISNISVTTLATPISSDKEATDSNVVKVVTNINNDALYFSRSKIPWNNTFNKNADNVINQLLLRHIGIYSYRAEFIHRYVAWTKSPLEQIEMLEQLRILWHGSTIRVAIIDNAPNISVDTPESLKRVNELFMK